MKPNHAKANKAWFFDERKLNMLKYTDSYKVRKVKRGEERGRCEARMLQSNECLRRMSSTISEIKKENPPIEIELVYRAAFEMPPQKVGEKKKSPTVAEDFPLNLNQNS